MSHFSGSGPGDQPGQRNTLLGHPTGLFTLFFAEMWERFSYYGMRALLVFYMIKGFLRYGDGQAYAVYGAYTALVYMTPFFGGMLADRLLGARRAVVLGGLLMAAGHLMMTVETEFGFFMALALLIAGNGFFKPNISTMVGSLYPQGSPKRDGGFTIFYMGINLGAAMSPLLCGYIGETYGWHLGFGLATIGMLTGLAVFVAPVRVTQILIMAGALAAAIGLFLFRPDNPFAIGVNIFVAVSLLAAGVTAWVALSRGGLPAETGAPPDPQRLRQPVGGIIPAEWAVYLGTLVAIPVLALLVSGFSPFTPDKNSVTIIPEEWTTQLAEGGGFMQVAAVVLSEVSRPAGLLLLLAGVVAFGYIGYETVRLDKIQRERMYVVLVLTFFSMLFWAFFEQAGSSVNNFTDRNVDRVFDAEQVTAADVGKTITFRIEPDAGPELNKYPLLTQEQLGRKYGNESLAEQIRQSIRSDAKKKEDAKQKEVDELARAATEDNVFTLTALTSLRETVKSDPDLKKTVDWQVTQDNVGMAVGGSENPASVFQALNPIYILLFGVVFSALWTFLGTRGLEPNTPIKFSLGLIQLGLGFGAFWYGAQTADARGMVGLSWLFLGYLLHTTGELCLSPVGLSMVTKMSPRFLVSTVMGMWFLATAFSQFLAAIIAQFTGVGHGDEGGATIPAPVQTVDLYGDVFGTIAITACISGLICLALSPILARWMHEDVRVDESTDPGRTAH
jgi:POT family proton-dependent oligopeptide transporter